MKWEFWQLLWRAGRCHLHDTVKNQEPNHIGNIILEGTSGDGVTWPLHEAGLARAPLVQKRSLCLLLPKAGLSGLFLTGMSGPAANSDQVLQDRGKMRKIPLKDYWCGWKSHQSLNSGKREENKIWLRSPPSIWASGKTHCSKKPQEQKSHRTGPTKGHKQDSSPNQT